MSTGDSLSEILTTARARCLVTAAFGAAGDWALVFTPRVPLKVFAVVRGDCVLAVGGERRRMSAGDVAILNEVDTFVVSSEPGVPAVPAADVLAAGGMTLLADRPDTVGIGGHIELGPVGRELIGAGLAPVTLVAPGSAESDGIRWLLGRLLTEMTAGRPAAGLATDHYGQALLIEVLRGALTRQADFPVGWLRVMADPHLAPALQLMLRHPERNWELAELAAAAAMSRTTFVARFRAAAGIPPITYLHHWRMHRAGELLRSTEVTVAGLSTRFGYSSESAFSNAFKRFTGLAPRHYRRAERERAG